MTIGRQQRFYLSEHFVPVRDAVVDGGVVGVTALMDQDMAGQRIDAVVDHADDNAPHQGPQKNHAPYTDDHGYENHRCPPRVAPDVSPGNLKIHDNWSFVLLFTHSLKSHVCRMASTGSSRLILNAG
jgi:hypothetical protein